MLSNIDEHVVVGARFVRHMAPCKAPQSMSCLHTIISCSGHNNLFGYLASFNRPDICDALYGTLQDALSSNLLRGMYWLQSAPQLRKTLIWARVRYNLKNGDFRAREGLVILWSSLVLGPGLYCIAGPSSFDTARGGVTAQVGAPPTPLSMGPYQNAPYISNW